MAAQCAAETLRLIDDFETIEWPRVDAGEFWGLGEENQPLTGSANLSLVPRNSSLGGSWALRVDYEVAWRHWWGVIGVTASASAVPFLGSYLPCANASHLSIKYRVAVPQNDQGLAVWGIDLWDVSNVDSPLDMPSNLTDDRMELFLQNFQSWELYGARDSHVLDDTTGAWKEVRFPLCHGALAFNMIGAARGNGVLDRDKLTGYNFAFTADPDRVEEVARGAIEFDDLACVEPDEWVDPCAAPDVFESESVPGVRYATASAFASHTLKTDVCDELCAAEPACLFYAIETTYDSWEVAFPRCYLFDALTHEDIIPAAEMVDVLAFWATSAAKRGALCAVCTCADGTADCRDRDLQTVPAAAGADATTLDLSDNPRLTLVGPGAFDGLDGLEVLVLPSGVKHLAPEALESLPALRDVSLATGDGVTRNFVDASSTARFDDVCCRREASSRAGVYFCDLSPDEPGVVDAVYEETNSDNIVTERFDRQILDSITPDSPFLAEAVESKEKCVAYCEMKAECQSCMHFTPWVVGATLTNMCLLYGDEPPANHADNFVQREVGGAYMGLPPRTRAARGAVVAASPLVVELSEANGYTNTFEVSLGADPLRGAVWITPRLEGFGNMSVAFDPPSITLYDAQTVVTVAVTVRGDEITRDLTPTVALDVEACDRAFVAQQATLQLDVLAAAVDDGGTRVSNAGAVVALVVVACVLVAAGLFYCLAAAVRFVRKKQQLEMARALQVRDQVAAAVEKIQEFQAIFATLPGDAFCALEKLVPHEALRKDLVIYDAIADVAAAKREGLVFVFLSHQWLAFASPDPANVHCTAMQQAVRAVAAAAGVPLASLRVWVDFISIPQRNRSEQRLSIASLPTFASLFGAPIKFDATFGPSLTDRSVRRSSCDFFVIVAPAAKHADTGCLCNAETYRKRSWCRAEVMSCWARNGRGDMWLSSSDGLRPLDEATLREAIDVAGGDLTCCRLHHARGDPCDREALVLPMLGLYAEIFRHRHAPRGREAYEFLAPIKETLFPRTFSYSYHGADGGVESAEETLFGDLLRAVETAVELSEADASNPIWRRALPDLSPGSTAQRHSHHLRTTKGAAASTRHYLSAAMASASGDPSPTQDAARVAIAVDAE